MAHHEEASWWQRNRSWALPVGGCGGCLLLLILLLVGLTVGGGAALLGGMKSSWPYSEALVRAQSDRRVIEALGEPIEARFWLSGSISVTGPEGDADLAIPLRGPNGSATLYSVARKSAGEWSFERLEVELSGSSQRLDLLSDP